MLSEVHVCASLTTGSFGFCRCTGFIFQKVGKLAATAVGGGFFLLQVCTGNVPGCLAVLLAHSECSQGRCNLALAL